MEKRDIRMKRLITIILVVCMVFGTCHGETTIHQFWNIDLSKATSESVAEYLSQEKGIYSKIVYNYDRKGHDSLRSNKEQEITLMGYPFSFNYTEYSGFREIYLPFEEFETEADVYNIINALVEKFGQLTFCYYDLYNIDSSSWDINNEPQYHKRKILDTLQDFSLLDSILSWEHYEDNPYYDGTIELTAYIDNIKIFVRCLNDGRCWMYIRFYSFVPLVECEEVDESRNLTTYVDTGF